MKKMIFSLFDKVSGGYMAPMFVANAAVVMRDVGDAVRKGDGNPLAAHPADYALYELGSFDDETGSFFIIPARLVFEVSSLLDTPG